MNKEKSKKKLSDKEFEISQSTQGFIVIGIMIVLIIIMFVIVLSGNYNRGF